MHAGEAMPRVAATAKMPDVIYGDQQKGFGHDDGRGRRRAPAGILTDGDLRRLMQQRGAATLDLMVGDCVTRNPRTIAPGELAGAALRMMEERKITSLVVVDAGGGHLGLCTCTICGRWNCFDKKAVSWTVFADRSFGCGVHGHK